MIVVNYWHDKDYDAETDSYSIHLAGVINDSFDLLVDPALIKEAIDVDEAFKPIAENLYELHLERATIETSYPHVEPAFAIVDTIKKIQDSETGEWKTQAISL